MVQEPLTILEKRVVRKCALIAWRSQTEAELAKMDAVELLRAKLGQKYLTAANHLAAELIDDWNRRGVINPPDYYTEGEPGWEPRPNL